MKKTVFTLMLLSCILILSGCGDKGKRTDNGSTVKFTASYALIDIDATVNHACISEGHVWLAGYRNDGARMSAYLALAGNDGTMLGDFSDIFSVTPPEGYTWEGSVVNEIFPLPCGGAAIYGFDIYSYEDVNNPTILPDGRIIPNTVLEDIYFAVSVDKDGRATGRLELPEEQGDNVLSFAADGERYYFMELDGKTRVLRADGTELCTIQTAGGELAPIGGHVACKDTAGSIRLVDADNAKLGERFGIKDEQTLQSYTLYPGGLGWDMLLAGSTTLLGCNKNGELGEIVTWLNVDIRGQSLMYASSEDDGLICICGDENGSGGKNIFLVRLSPIESDISDKTILRLFCMGLSDDISRQILSFNRTSADYRIELRDYAVYSDAAYTRLNADLISGDIPDIFCADGLPMESYAARGMLEDLWPYIDADAEFGGRDALVLPLFYAMSRHGHLYEVTDSFGICSVAGRTEYAKNGWSMADFMAAYEKMPSGCSVLGAEFTRTGALYLALSLRFGEFVDVENGSCRFDSEDFLDIVRFAELFPKEAGYDSDEFARIQGGEQMLTAVWVKGVFDLDKALCVFDDEGAALGMPGAKGSGSAFSPGSSLAMSASSKHKEGAWSFLRRLLLQQNQRADSAVSMYFAPLPSNRAALEQLIADAGAPNMNDGKEEPKFVIMSQGHKYSAYALTEKKAKALEELIASTESIIYWDDSLFALISEELDAYYGGDKTLEQATHNIQSRVELYLQSLK